MEWAQEILMRAGERWREGFGASCTGEADSRWERGSEFFRREAIVIFLDVAPGGDCEACGLVWLATRLLQTAGFGEAEASIGVKDNQRYDFYGVGERKTEKLQRNWKVA